jgi:hypothetical protein
MHVAGVSPAPAQMREGCVVQMLELLGSRGYILARLGPGVWLKAASKMGRTGLALPANIPYGPVPMLRISPVYSQWLLDASVCTNESPRPQASGVSQRRE